jgi:uncharacterized RDD family membrane protein YckC
MTEVPPSAVSAAAPAVPLLLAPPLRRRMAAWLYEGVLMFGILVPAGLVFSIATDMRHALLHRHGMIAFLFVVLAAYFAWFWSRGQTLAMKTWHIRVVDRFGRPLTQPRALLRYVYSWLWFLPPLAVLAPFKLPAGESTVIVFGWVAVWAVLSRFHPQHQFWHDALAGTRLVTAPDRKASSAS